jgi:hypothetical protein
VPKDSVAIASGQRTFYNNARTAKLNVKCELFYTEERNKDTERLYPRPTLSEGRANVAINDNKGWWDEIHYSIDGIASVD